MKKVMIVAILVLGLVLMSMPAFSTPLSVFDGWTLIADDDGVGAQGFVDPGWGGQDFDAEYLFYQLNDDKTKLSIGLQTGFDIIDGKLTHGNKDYYAGDLALSFDDCGANGWEYGVEFGWYQQDYYPDNSNDPNNDLNNNGTDNDPSEVGLYRVSAWNGDVYTGYTSSAPFAIKSGSKVSVGFTPEVCNDAEDGSYWRIVTFDVADLVGVTGGIQNIAAHWTMSCGNDVVEGCAPVPEPQTLLLMGIGLLCLAFIGRKKLGERS